MPRPYVLGEALGSAEFPGLPPWDGTGIPLPVDENGWPIFPDTGPDHTLTLDGPTEAYLETGALFTATASEEGHTPSLRYAINGGAEQDAGAMNVVDATTFTLTVTIAAPDFVIGDVVTAYAVDEEGVTSNTVTTTVIEVPAPPAGDEGEPTEPVVADEGYDPGDYTVAEVQAYLTDHPDQSEYVLDRERAGKARVSLIGA